MYERATGQLEDRGAGLGIPLSLLHTWDVEQSAEGRRLVTLGQIMGQAFV
ncbi:MAG: hypothetical protein OEU26_24340 [Candidatus Tectomicrobia bacterium]|nr:hypothetical protein [Candidatus Tectomicrobia bacterium]